MVLAENLRRAARRRGLSINALADFATVSRSQLHDVLATRKGATIDWLAKVAAVLQVEAWELLVPSAERLPARRRQSTTRP